MFYNAVLFVTAASSDNILGPVLAKLNTNFTNQNPFSESCNQGLFFSHIHMYMYHNGHNIHVFHFSHIHMYMYHTGHNIHVFHCFLLLIGLLTTSIFI
jgi:hypothetical protein